MTISLSRAVLVSAVALTSIGVLSPQQVSQTQRAPQFENADVSVWETTVMPNAPLNMHTHQHPRVIIALSGGTMKVVNEDGTCEAHQLETGKGETGKACWLSAEEGKKARSRCKPGLQAD